MSDTPSTNGAMSIHDMPVETVPLDQIQPMPGNPRIGNRPMLVNSLDYHGQYRPIIAQRSSGHIIAGNNTFHAAKEHGATEIAVQWLDVGDDHARKINLADNRMSDKATYDDRLLLEFLTELPDLDGTGYEPGSIESLEHLVTGENYDGDRADEKAEGEAAGPQRRTMPLDLIFSWRPDTALGLIAAQMGWGLGCISTAVQSARSLYRRYPEAPRLTFMDNEWHGYDHQVHTDAVAEMQPVYATVRDLVTREQAEHEQVAWYSLDDTLDMAAEIAEHVDNVILIPKYDCLDKLPEKIGGARVVLGYSVESSYGGTPVPIKAFSGRPIHLLGGSWKTQRSYLNLMRDDVVSLDTNHFCNIAQWANVTMPAGDGRNLAELLDHPVHRAFYAAAVCSMAAISSSIVEDYGADLTPQQIAAPESTGTTTAGGEA